MILDVRRKGCWLALWIGLNCLGMSQEIFPPALVGLFGGGSVELGGRISLAVRHQPGSNLGLQYQWKHADVELPGETRSTLIIDPAKAEHTGTYKVTASNAAGSSVASTQVTVLPPAPPVVMQQPGSAVASVGQTVSFSASVGGSLPRSFQWLRDGIEIPGATRSLLVLGPVTLADVAAYSVRVSNPFGSVVSVPAALTVNPAQPPVLAPFSPSVLKYQLGQYVNLQVPIRSGTSPFTIEWYKNGQPFLKGPRDTLTLAGTLLEDTGVYTALVSNAAGSVMSDSVEVTILPGPPPLSPAINNQTIEAGSPLDMAVGSWSDTGLQAFWYKDGHYQQKAWWRSSYSVSSSATPGDSGTYLAVLANASGAEVVGPAQITVLTGEGNSERSWHLCERAGDIVYLFYRRRAKIDRYHLGTQQWLSSIALPGEPTAFTATSQALYVAYGPVLSRMNLDGSGAVAPTAGFTTSVMYLKVLNDFLFVFGDSRMLATVRLSDGSKVWTPGYGQDITPPLVVGASSQTAFAPGRQSSFDFLTAYSIKTDGALLRKDVVSEISEMYPTGRLVLSPDEKTLIAEHGHVFQASSLKFLANLGGAIDDVGFTTDGRALVLRGETVGLRDTAFREIARKRLTVPSRAIFVRGDSVFLFAPPSPSGSVEVTRFELGEMEPLSGSKLPAVAKGNGFIPSAATLDRNGVLLLFSKVQGQIFRWSTVENRFLDSIPLRGWPYSMAYSSPLHLVHLAYADGSVTQIDLSKPTFQEEHFATVPGQVTGAFSADDKLVVYSKGQNGYHGYYTVFDSSGRGVISPGRSSREYTWNSARKRFYHIYIDQSPTDLVMVQVNSDGTIGERTESPYHGDISIRDPLRVSPDGSFVLLGSGIILDGTTLRQNNTLPQPVDEAVWLGNRPVTARRTSRGIELERWGATHFAKDASIAMSGESCRLVVLPGNRVLAVILTSGLPRFITLNADLEILREDFAGRPERMVNLSTRAWTGRGSDVLITGFVIAGAEPKTMLLRAAGPALSAYGVPGTLLNPTLSLFDSSGALMLENDNWTYEYDTFFRPVTRRVGAFPFPDGSVDSAILVTLPPGGYTLHASGLGEQTGITLVEVYDSQDNAGGSKLVNLSTRARVGTGADILITGLVVQSEQSRTVLVRAVGPSLQKFGVAGVLENPKLQLFKGSEMQAENDNWSEGLPEQVAAIVTATAKTGAFALPSGSQDACLLLTLPAGSYTLHVSGADGGAGVALVEVYDVP